MCGIGEMAISGHCCVCSGMLGRTRCLFLDGHLQRIQKPLAGIWYSNVTDLCSSTPIRLNVRARAESLMGLGAPGVYIR